MTLSPGICSPLPLPWPPVVLVGPPLAREQGSTPEEKGDKRGKELIFIGHLVPARPMTCVTWFNPQNL